MPDITTDGAPDGLLLRAPFGRGWICITPWPELQAWYRPLSPGLWQPMDDARLPLRRLLRDARIDDATHSQLPLFPQLEPKIERRTNAEALAFFAAIPLRARTAAFRFPSRQQSLLALAAAHDFAWELLDPHARGNPALAFGLALRLSDVTNTLARRAIIERMFEPRRIIARDLGFSGSRVCLAILSRIPPRHLSPRMMREMVTVLESAPAVDLLQRLPEVTPTAVALLLRPRLHRVLTARFLHELRHHPTPYRREMVELVTRYAERGENEHGSALPRLFSLRELDEALKRWASIDVPREFPCPLPIADPSLALTPLMSLVAIEQEAADMQHCLNIYATRIARHRDHFAYRLDAPERATVLIERRHERWRVVQARGRSNRMLRPDTVALLRAAVARAQQ
jgi:hypothetical protein